MYNTYVTPPYNPLIHRDISAFEIENDTVFFIEFTLKSPSDSTTIHFIICKSISNLKSDCV